MTIFLYVDEEELLKKLKLIDLNNMVSHEYLINSYNIF